MFEYWEYLFRVKKKHNKLDLKEEKRIFKPLAGIEPHMFGLLVRRVNHYTTRTNHAKNAAS